MRKKLLLFAAVLLGGLSGWADTEDVTSTYLTNADFEGTYSSYSQPKSDRDIYQPEGWTVSYTNGETNDMTSLNSSTTQWSNFSSLAQPSNGGSNTYWVRFRWGSSENLTLSQEVTLPAGYYVLSADAFKNTTKATPSISIGGNSVTVSTSNAWANYSVEYFNPKEQKVTISFTFKQSSADNNIAGFDNFKLTYVAPVAMGSLSNLNFETGEAQTATVRTSSADITSGSSETSGMQAVSGWHSFLSISGSSNNHAAGIFAINGGVGCGSPTNTAPTTNASGNAEGNALGLVAVWTATTQYFQPVTLAAGSYTMTAQVYNQAGTSDVSKNLIGFITASGTEYLASAKTYTVGQWTKESISFQLSEETVGYLSLGYTSANSGSGAMPHLFIDDVTLTTLDISAWTNAKTAAQTALDTYNNTDYASAERSTVTTTMALADPTTAETLNSQTQTLTDATAAFIAAYAKDKTQADNATYVSNYNTMKAKYTDNVAESFVKGTFDSTSGQHWDGTTSTTYYDKWSGSAMTATSSLTVELPAGDYAFVAAGRGAVGNTPSIYVKVGDNDATTYSYPATGDTGLGIATDGSASYDWRNGTFANSNAGRGWTWGYVEFSLTETSSVTLTYSAEIKAGSWASIASPGLFCTEATSIAAQKAVYDQALAAAKAVTGDMNKDVKSALDAAIGATPEATAAGYKSAAEDLTTATANANTSIANYTAAKTYIDAMQTKANTLDETGKSSYAANEDVVAINKAYTDATMESLTDDNKTALTTALTTAVKAQTSENAVFTLAMANPSFEEGTTGWTNVRNTTGTYDYKIVTDGPADGTNVLNVWAQQFNYSRVWQKVTLPAGTYTLSAKARSNQTPLYTRVCAYISGKQAAESDNLTYAAPEEGHAWNDADAFVTLTTTFSILAETEVEMGIYSNGQNVWNNTQGFFQVDDFQLVRNGDAPITCTRTTATSKYGTICLPYAFTAEGATLHTISAIDNGSITLTEGGTEGTAGVPYIYCSTSDKNKQTFTYSGAPIAKPTAGDNGLIGSFTLTAVPANSYVLQTQNDVQGFYKVAADNSVYCGANKCYLTVSDGARSAYFFGGDETGIETVNALNDLLNGDAKIYDLNGRQLQSLQKGVNIVNGKKIIVK